MLFPVGIVTADTLVTSINRNKHRHRSIRCALNEISDRSADIYYGDWSADMNEHILLSKRRLSHRLSPYALDAAGAPLNRRNTTQAELAYFVPNSSHLNSLIETSSGNGLRTALSSVGSGLGIDGSLRERGCRTSLDRAGNACLFPPAESLPDLLDSIAYQLQVNYERGPFFRALWTFTALLNAHALRDGNGRISRIAFNSLLWNGANNNYLPIYDLAMNSCYALEIGLRQAYFTGDWIGLLEFFDESIACYRRAMPSRRKC